MYVFFFDTLNIELYVHVLFCSTFYITFVGSFHTDFFFYIFHMLFFGSETIDIELLKTHNTFVCISRNDFLYFLYVFLLLIIITQLVAHL